MWPASTSPLPAAAPATRSPSRSTSPASSGSSPCTLTTTSTWDSRRATSATRSVPLARCRIRHLHLTAKSTHLVARSPRGRWPRRRRWADAPGRRPRRCAAAATYRSPAAAASAASASNAAGRESPDSWSASHTTRCLGVHGPVCRRSAPTVAR